MKRLGLFLCLILLGASAAYGQQLIMGGINNPPPIAQSSGNTQATWGNGTLVSWGNGTLATWSN